MASHIPERSGGPQAFFWYVVISLGALLILGAAMLYATLVLTGVTIPGEITDIIGLGVLAANFVVMGVLGRGQGKTDDRIAVAAMEAEAGRAEHEERLRELEEMLDRRATERIEELRQVVGGELNSRFITRSDHLRKIVREEIEKAIGG